MRISRDITRTTSLCILMTTVLLSGVAPVMGAGDRDWLDTMVQAVLAEQGVRKDLCRSMWSSWRPCAHICSTAKAKLCTGR